MPVVWSPTPFPPTKLSSCGFYLHKSTIFTFPLKSLSWGLEQFIQTVQEVKDAIWGTLCSLYIPPWGGMLWFCWKQDEDRAVAFAGAVQPRKFRRSFGILSSCTVCMNGRSELPCLMYLSLTSAGSGLLGHGCCPAIGGLERKVRSLVLCCAIKANIIGFHWINGMWSWAKMNADQLEISQC